MFVDRVEIDVEAGRGGDGCMSFRREKYVPKGGPDGGDGGRGGSIILRAQEGVNSLAPLTQKRRWNARNGQPGQGSNCHGRDAEDVILLVPPGTVIRDAKAGFIMKDLATAGDQVTVAQGGAGGKGNTRFKSSTHRAPREHTPGEEGERRALMLELKVIADVGLVGLPNAGKSTLLSRVSRARPEIADYPFTTKYPNLGRVQLGYDDAFIMADIPGLVEGAHAGIGLGHEFLRHVQRAGILIHLVEPAPVDGSDPLSNYRAIRDELRQFDPTLVQRPEVVVVTKADYPQAEEVRSQLATELGQEVLLISAVTGQGLDRMLAKTAELLKESKTQA